MKKYIAKLSAVLMTAVILSGCTAETDTHTTMSELCIFRQRSDGTPIRTMLSSGITSTVCVDPLCMHDAECPLAGISNLTGEGAIALGDYYCFVSGDAVKDGNTGVVSGEVKLCVYRMTDGKIRVLESYPDSILIMDGTKNYLYYTAAAYSESDFGEQYSYTIYRADIESGKIIEIPIDKEYVSVGNAMSTADFPDIYAIDGDTIYWYAPQEEGYVHYTTDLAGKNRKELPLANPRIMNGVYYDGWAYYTMNRNEGSIADCKTDLERQKFLNEKTLRRYHLETEKDEIIADNLARFIVTEAGIFYTVYETEPKEIEFNNDTYYDIFAGKIYRMNHDGSSTALFCTLEDVNLSVWSDVFLGYAEGRLAVAYMDAVENDWFESGYDYNIASEIIIVDTADGTWGISTDET